MKNYLKKKIKKYTKELEDYKDQFLWCEFGEGDIMGKISAYEKCLEHIQKADVYKIYHIDVPAFKHDCDKCKFMKSIRSSDGLTIDLYKSCDASQKEYIIRYSSEGSEYATVKVEDLALAYAEKMTGNKG